MSALIKPLRHVLSSAQKILSPRKRRREELNLEEDVDEQAFVGPQQLNSRATTGILPPEERLPDAPPSKKLASGEQKPSLSMEVQVGSNVVAPAVKDVIIQDSMDASGVKQLAPDEQLRSVYSELPNTSSMNGEQRRPLLSRNLARSQHLTVLDRYAHMKSVEGYRRIIRGPGGPLSTRSSLQLYKSHSRGTNSDLFHGQEQGNTGTTRRLSYGTPATKVASLAITNDFTLNDEIEKQKLFEQEKLREENRILREKISAIERKSAPLLNNAAAVERIVVSDLLGEGVNAALLQKKLDKVEFSFPSLQEYRRRQALRQSEILMREQTLERIRASIRARNEPFFPEDELLLQEFEESAEPLDEEVIELGLDEDEFPDEETQSRGFELMEDDINNYEAAGASVEDESDPLSNLTEIAQKRVDIALSPSLQRDKVLVTMQKMTLTREDMLRLRSNQWLNDEIINCYTTLLQDRSDRMRNADTGWPNTHFFSTFFYTRLVTVTDYGSKYDYPSVRRWTRKVDVFSKDVLVFPINLSNTHWTCAVIDMRSRQLSYYDSLGGQNEKVLRNLGKWLEDESQDKKKTKLSLEEEGWSYDCPGHKVPQQENCDDCGVFACKFADYASCDRPFDFSARHMNYFRRRMAAELLAKRAC
eukprot:Plantae.Rhodophyta-Purpureofilum_apyrenoidigerum.ctg7175.p1 GENE.Plantae.Rhodophyta-Purpureofilum_apyrenoidigerum.ctg7175~~Plantae.Rhodophyta-Purpureofilum_apyrenoidigerum.ctg7175.p1  ORF type:complete len:646 (+),score=113.60 Plantae.Rhodophyta-Purpureofilum_apyrenoidigerum.ctg7175:535-2472(+)